MGRSLRRGMVGVATAALVAIAGWAPSTASAGVAVSDLPTLALTVDAGAFAAVNADVNHDTTAMVNVEVTDPGNSQNNLVVADGLTEIKGRGNYTWTLPSKKKPYQLKFADGNSQNLLGMGAARAWVLLANTADPSLMRNKVALDLAEEFGMAFTGESRWVDLMINGQNWGNYLLAEKVEVKKTRVDLKSNQGVLIEQDYNYGSGDPVFHQTPRLKSKDSAGGYYVLKDAKGGNPDTAADLLTPAYANTKAGWDDFVAKIDALDLALADPNANWATINGLIDLDSFVKMFFVYEFTENQEIARSSVMFYRDATTGKIFAGPVWDFDVAMGNFDDSLYGRGGNPEVDYVANVVTWRPDGKGSDWFPQLLKSSAFNARATALYPELRPRIENVPSKIGEYRSYLTRSAGANFSRWPGILGNRTLLPYGSRTYASTFNGEVDRLASWVNKRVTYLNQRWGGSATSTASCQASTPPGSNTTAGTFNALNPCRMLDTRFATGVPTTTAVPAGADVTLKVTGRGGVPDSASAVALNVTVAGPTQPGYLSVYAAGNPLPLASNLNFVARQDVPNHVISSVGSGGNVTLHNGSTGTVHVIADVLGYFAGGGAASIPGSFQANVPNRVLDTRVASDVTAGAAVGHGREVSLQVTGSHPSSTGAPVVVPEDASAVVLNVTAVAPTEAGYVTAYPNGSARPLASNVNFARGTTAVPNLVTVKVGDAGKVNLYVGTDPDPVNGKVHLIADIVGYYVGGEATQPGTFVPLTPKRILDSRDGAGMVTKLGITPLARRVNNYETIALDVAGGLGQPPTAVAAAVMNVTVANPTAIGHVTIFPDGTSRPVVSSLNYVAWQTVPNLVTVRTGDNGKVDFYTFSAGQTDLIADVAGFYRK